MNRGRRAFIATALLLLAVLGGAGLVFREAIRERWLIWKLEHGSLEQADKAAAELGRMGSVRAIDPLARRLGLAPSRPWTLETQTKALSALIAIASTRRADSLPYIEAALENNPREVSKDVLWQLARMARREVDHVCASFQVSHDTIWQVQLSPPLPSDDDPVRLLPSPGGE